MSDNKKSLGITDVVLRDAHQSLLATRMRLDDMLPIASKLDKVGFWSLESWGGATFDSCIRYLGEDPWNRIRELKKAMPNTPQQMLFRGQNILGYRHYADDVVNKFVERAAFNGVDVFRIFDAMNDIRNLKTAIYAVKNVGKHAQGTISYTVSPVHTINLWIDFAKQLEDMGADSICIKDMAGLLKPYVAQELIKKLKKNIKIPIHMQCHATTGLSTATALKAIEAGIDNIDTAISSMSMTYGHSPTETVVAMLENTIYETNLNIVLLEEISTYFRQIRSKYNKFEGSLRGVDSRILITQVPGGMLTNMENQLREQNAIDKLNIVLEEIPKVRLDLGLIPLVTPTSQIVGTQAVLNILSGERYKTISKEVAGLLKGEYGKTPAPVNLELKTRVLCGKKEIICRPADLIKSELNNLESELINLAKSKSIELITGSNFIDDVLTYALFPQIGIKFLKNKNDPSFFEPIPGNQEKHIEFIKSKKIKKNEVYTITVSNQSYIVNISEGENINNINTTVISTVIKTSSNKMMNAPLAGNIFKVQVIEGQQINEGDIIIILEAMKMETEVRSTITGIIKNVNIKEGDSVAVGDKLITIV